MKRLLFLILLLITTPVMAWDPPVGIPNPNWGIETTHMMYADGDTYHYDFGEGPVDYPIDGNGVPYTHYMYPDHPSATDTDNPWGTHTTPRLTRPNKMSGNLVYGSKLAAGTVMIFHAGIQPGIGTTELDGTAELPIFFVGVEGSEPTWETAFTIEGDYLIFDQMKYQVGDTGKSAFLINSLRTNFCVKNSEFWQDGEFVPNESYQIIRIMNDDGSADTVDNVVIYNNYFHNIGEGRTGGSYDPVAVSGRVNVDGMWVVDNTFAWIGGDGIQLDADTRTGDEAAPKNVYIGRNTFHDLYENAVDLKNCEDVILSRNIAYNFGPEYTTLHAGHGQPAFRQGGQDIADAAIIPRRNIWHIFNEVYNSDCEDGAFLASSNRDTDEPRADEIYFIGNLIRDCKDSSTVKSCAFSATGQHALYWINNTVYNCDYGVQVFMLEDDPAETFVHINNIYSECGDFLRGYMVIGTGDANSADFGGLTMSNATFFDSGGADEISTFSNPGGYNTQSVADFKTEYSQFATGVSEADPKFTDPANQDFTLQGDSPCINNGADLSAHYTTFNNLYSIDIYQDYVGTPLPVVTEDIGAWEFTGGVTQKYLFALLSQRKFDEVKKYIERFKK